MPEKLAFRRIAVAAHPKIPAAEQVANEIAAFLHDQGLEVTAGDMQDESLRQGVQAGRFDLWIALGGDGTMLRSGHLCGPCQLPILGINMGNLGFLMGIQQEEWRERLMQLLAGEYWLEPRMMLDVSQHRGGKVLGSWDVLNEAMVGRGCYIRPIRLETRVDGCYLSSLVADGLIAATATGSTAYALAAGGPVLPPELRNILLVPVAPHLSFDRSVVLAEGAEVCIQAKSSHGAVLSLDGQPSVSLEDGDEVQVRASQHTVQFVRLRAPDYFYSNLTSRLNSNSHRM